MKKEIVEFLDEREAKKLSSFEAGEFLLRDKTDGYLFLPYETSLMIVNSWEKEEEVFIDDEKGTVDRLLHHNSLNLSGSNFFIRKSREVMEIEYLGSDLADKVLSFVPLDGLTLPHETNYSDYGGEWLEYCLGFRCCSDHNGRFLRVEFGFDLEEKFSIYLISDKLKQDLMLNFGKKEYWLSNKNLEYLTLLDLGYDFNQKRVLDLDKFNLKGAIYCPEKREIRIESVLPGKNLLTYIFEGNGYLFELEEKKLLNVMNLILGGELYSCFQSDAKLFGPFCHYNDLNFTILNEVGKSTLGIGGSQFLYLPCIEKPKGILFGEYVDRILGFNGKESNGRYVWDFEDLGINAELIVGNLYILNLKGERGNKNWDRIKNLRSEDTLSGRWDGGEDLFRKNERMSYLAINFCDLSDLYGFLKKVKEF